MLGLSSGAYTTIYRLIHRGYLHPVDEKKSLRGRQTMRLLRSEVEALVKTGGKSDEQSQLNEPRSVPRPKRFADVPDRGGVYLIKNIDTGWAYAGASMRLPLRFIDHQNYLRNGGHTCDLLQRDWNKFGEDRFQFEVVELSDDRQYLSRREQELIDNLIVSNKCYNKLKYSSYSAIERGGAKVFFYTDKKLFEKAKRAVLILQYRNIDDYLGAMLKDAIKRAKAVERTGEK